MVNTFVAPAAGALGWMGAERLVSGKPSMLGGASGAVAGLVAVTPAAAASGPVGAMLLGALASFVCYGFVGSVKNRMSLDDSLDVFGIHGLGGIIGSIGTAFVAMPEVGGHGGTDYSLGWQLLRQVAAVAVAIGWSAAGSALCFAIVKRVIALRHARDAEREGLDISDHGERAYNY
jgi:Amt family ammonium transporter